MRRDMHRCFVYSFGENFIERLADLILSLPAGDGNDLSRIACVFGGRRPALFLRKALAERLKGPFFPPRVFSMDEFMEYILSASRPLNRINDLEAAYLIYEIVRKTGKSIVADKKKFSEFFPWAEEVVSFIENLDLENVEDKSLELVQKSAAVGYDVPDSINRLLKDIVDIRRRYHKSLMKENMFSRGMVYREAVSVIRQRSFDEFERIIFANFFYLHRTEFSVIKEIYSSGKGMVVFQGDPEEWPLLKENIRGLEASAVKTEEVQTCCRLHFYAAGDLHSQVAVVRDVLKEIKDHSNTVIVLPRASALIPLISEISSIVEDFNVSMGYPLQRSSIFSLLDAVRRAQETRKGDLYYTPDYLNLLRHPLIKNLDLMGDVSVTRLVVHKIEEFLKGTPPSPLGGNIFIDISEVEGLDEVYTAARDSLRGMELPVSISGLKELVRSLHRVLFREWEGALSIESFCRAVDTLMKTMVEHSPLEKFPFNVKVTARILDMNEEFKTLSFASEQMGQREVFSLFLQKLSSEVISFTGSPLKGLQVLGLFETRSLNFDNVIVMDMNESVFPKLKLYEPLIPREVMINLDLNRLEKEEQIQRYQFMRLIGAAKHAYLIYADNQVTERSRFIEELIWKKQRELKSLDVVDVPRAVFPFQVTGAAVSIDKNDEIIDFLKQHTYSASSLNTYLNCPLQFYYKYVLGISEGEDLLEEPESADIGTFLHELLEEGFRKFLGRRPVVDAGFRRDFMRMFEEKFSATLMRRMKADSFLLKGVIKNRLEKFLDAEAANEEVKRIICLEKDFYGKMDVGGVTVNLIARIDRIDEYDENTVLVIDYKSGRADNVPAKQRVLSMNMEREAIYEAVKSFQLPLYCYLVRPQFPDYDIAAGLYSLRSLEKKMFISSADKDAVGVLDRCIDAARYILGEILDPDVSFVPVKDENRCRVCPFSSVCV